MKMKNKYIAIGAVVLLVLGYSIGRYITPPTEITKTEIEEREVIKRDIVTVVKEVTRPDGTKETITETTDKSKEKRDKTVESLVSIPKEKQWHISAGVERAKLDSVDIYSLTVERRIFLGGYAGVRVNTDKQIGLTIGYEF
jgi:hypothetical protein